MGKNSPAEGGQPGTDDQWPKWEGPEETRPRGYLPAKDKKPEKGEDTASDKQALRLAETTDVSPRQAKELIEQHGRKKAAKEAKQFKAES